MSNTCNSEFDEFCPEENNNDTKREETPTHNFFYDLFSSPEAQVAAGIVATGAAIAYNAFTGEDVCLGGVCCTKTDGCHHHHN